MTKTRTQKRNADRKAKNALRMERRDTLAPLVQVAMQKAGNFISQQQTLAKSGNATASEVQLLTIDLLALQVMLLWNIYDPRG